MEGNIREASVAQGLLIQADRGGELITLIVKNQGKKVIPRLSADITRFINKNGELLHGVPPLDNKNAGGNPPALDSPLL